MFLPTVGKRGAAIIVRRAACLRPLSAANAAIDHMRDWALGTNGKWVTMGMPADGGTAFPNEAHVRLSGHLRKMANTRWSKGLANRRLSARSASTRPWLNWKAKKTACKHLL